MAELLGQDVERPWEIQIELPVKLNHEFQRGLELDAGRVVYYGSRHSLPGESKTGYEFFGSKVYIADYTVVQEPLVMLLRLGIGYAFELSKSLLAFNDSFKIYIFGHLEDSFSKINDACVQFHLNRSEEEPPFPEVQIYSPGFNPTMIINFESS